MCVCVGLLPSHLYSAKQLIMNFCVLHLMNFDLPYRITILINHATSPKHGRDTRINGQHSQLAILQWEPNLQVEVAIGKIIIMCGCKFESSIDFVMATRFN